MRVEILQNRNPGNALNIEIRTTDDELLDGQACYDTTTQEYIPTEADVDLFFDSLFPVGTVLPFAGETLPSSGVWHFCDGEDDTVNMEGALLRGDTSYTGDIELSSMPDKSSGYNYGGANAGPETIGVFVGSSRSGRVGGWASTSGGNWGGVHDGPYYFDASRSSSIYKNGQTKVQPEATKVRFIVRVA